MAQVGLPADELLLLHLGAGHARLHRRVLALELGAVRAVALLEPSGRAVDPDSDGDNAMLRPCLEEEIPQLAPLLDRDVQLPAEVADVGDARGEHAQVSISTTRQAPKGKPSFETSSRVKPLHDVACARPPDAERRPAGRQIRHLSCAVRRQMIASHLRSAIPCAPPVTTRNTSFAETHHGEVGLEAAALATARACTRRDRPRLPSAARSAAAPRRAHRAPSRRRWRRRRDRRCPRARACARCSALMMGDHQRASHSCSRRPTRSPYSSSSGAFDSYHCGRSQPTASKKTAPSARSRSLDG